MRQFYLTIALAIGFFLGATLAHADGCQQVTIYQDGVFKMCTICTYGSQVTVTCF
jgi:hypothetical protein